jgi:signal transduction histidine kinase/ActR/RegA family two-component response regulator
MSSLLDEVEAIGRTGSWKHDLVTGEVFQSEGQRRIFFGDDPTKGTRFEDYSDAIHPDDREYVMGRHTAILAEGGATDSEIEYRIIWPDRTVHYIFGRLRVERDANGKAIRTVGTNADVTEQRRAQLELRQAQKMEAVGRLAGSVAHDFNNLLCVILSYATMLTRDNMGGMEREGLDEIVKACDHGATLTRQLLGFSRPQSARVEVLDLNAVVQGVEPMLRRLAGESARLNVIASAAPAHVRASRGYIEQALMNLVVNARDATPSGGTVTIEVAEAGPDVVLTVRDDGAGMDDDTMTRIFEPFFTTKEPGKGTGLGLAIVLSVVRDSGGTVTVDSAPGKGATFRLAFPRTLDAPLAAAPASPVHEATAARTGTILLVEDDEQVRAVARTILRRLGYTVLDVPNAGEALLTSERHAGTIDLLLTDVVLPQTSGPELARRLQPMRPTMKVLLMSGYASEDVARQVQDAGLPLLDKPFSPDLLAEAVDALVGNAPRSISAHSSTSGTGTLSSSS